jgi:hypothetical protein
MTFPTRGPKAVEFLTRSLDLFRKEGVPVPVVSGGGTPALLDLADFRWSPSIAPEPMSTTT